VEYFFLSHLLFYIVKHLHPCPVGGAIKIIVASLGDLLIGLGSNSSIAFGIREIAG